MAGNSRFALLMTRYAQFDRVTLILAGLALAAVLGGWALSHSRSGKADRIFTQIYFGFLIIIFVLIMVGTFILSGGTQ